MTKLDLKAALEIPAIVAPMFLVSSPAMTLAACAEGVMGSFPAHATRTREVFEDWLKEVEAGLAALRANANANGRKIAPYAVNLVTHASNPRMAGDLELCIEYRVPVVLTSKSAPTAAVDRIHAYGGIVLHDIASLRHAEKALEGGVDGLIVVTQGAGGHTGTVNPFDLMNEVRRIHDGLIVLSGCIATGRDVLAAEAMGADFAYIGTPFIATHESIASERHKQAIIASQASDIFFSAAVDGAPANWITQSLLDCGADLDVLRTTLPGKIISADETKKRWKDILTAGQGVGAVTEIMGAGALCQRLKREYAEARAQMLQRWRA
ncbi:MAG: NAD(P)H-dependent flavin oxidoreductase [Hyphomonadaceae bacterium]